MASFSDKLNRLLNSVTKRTGIGNVIPGTKIYDMCESVAYEQYTLEQTVDEKFASESLISATGSNLNRIGEDIFGTQRRGEIRTSISASMKVIKFYVKYGTFGTINNGAALVIPEGTLLEGDVNGIIYRFRTTEQYTLGINETEKYISASMVQGDIGAIPSGSIKTHNFTTYVQAASKSLLVTNTGVISTGRPVETDDNYRYRIINSFRAFPKTTRAGILEIVTDVPGVTNAIIENASNGGGSYTVYIQGVSPVTSDELIEDVKLALVQSIGILSTFNISKMNYIGLKLGFLVTMKNPTAYITNTSFIERIQDAVANYINNFYGDKFYLLDIEDKVQALSSDVLDVKITSASKYVGLGITRQEYILDVANEPNQIINIGSLEKLIVETINSPINVVIQ